MAFGLPRIFGYGRGASASDVRPRLQMSEWPAVVYAIGDVHGCIAQLHLLHQRILADASKIEGDKLIVGLGDYVDRGIDSAGVLDFLMSRLPDGFRRICLAGNHELMMLEHFGAPHADDRWLRFGGVETLISYGIDPSRYVATTTRERVAILRSHIPNHHLEFLKSLPLMLTLPGLVLVHAGIRVGVPLAEQEEDDLLWMRERANVGSIGEDVPLVVHGHTPTSAPRIVGKDISIDTGAFATGILTAIRLRQGEKPSFLNVVASDQ